MVKLIWAIINKMDNNIIFLKVKSHNSKSKMNDEADIYAKRGARDMLYLYSIQNKKVKYKNYWNYNNLEMMKKLIKRKIKKINEENIKSYMVYRKDHYFKYNIHLKMKYYKKEIRSFPIHLLKHINNLRYQHNCLNSFLFKKEFIYTNKCTHCNKVENEVHFLLCCNKYKDERKILKQQFMDQFPNKEFNIINILFPPINFKNQHKIHNKMIQHLINYILSTKRFNIKSLLNNNIFYK